MEVYLGLGSNLGDRKTNLEKALQLLGERLTIRQVSSLYQTEPVGHKEQPMFLNAVCRAETDLGPLQLLSLIKGIETALGRVPSFADGPRSIDVDILLYGGLSMETADLTIPHPRMAERAFVLIPLLELTPELVHPVSGESVKDLAAAVQGQQGVEKIGKLEGK
jgi:2-amino-4-hydroxy-6-hydroxymethyldihydropteridine diphosphokinase